MKHLNLLKGRAGRLLSGYAVLLLTLFSITAAAQPTYFNNNTGSSSNSFPFNTGSSSSNKVQWLYRNTYFPSASSGMITDIYFRTNASASSFTMTGVQIRMGQSTLATFPSGTYITGLNLVYTSASVTVTKLTGGWLRFTLQTPFLYDNTKNFIVEAICMNSSGATMAQNNSAATGRIYGNYLNASGTSGSGLVDFGFDLEPKKGMNNASVASIASPSGVFCANSIIPVSVNVKNKGFNRINNVKVYWSVDAAPPSVVNWTTLIDTIGSAGGNNAVVPLGNITFGTLPRTLKVYTSIPNGIADTVNNDDTLFVTLGPGLNGVYTVGGTSPDFPNVVAAANALNSFGVCGPVTMNIRPGTYTGAVSLVNIGGTSSTNRILFQPEDGSPTSVTLTYAATGANDNYVVKMNGTSYTTFRKLKMVATGTSFGTVVYMSSNTVNDSIYQCTMNTGFVNNAGFNILQLDNVTGTCDNFVLQNNTFNGGYCGVSASATTANPLKSWLIENNQLINVTRGIVVSAYTDLKVRGNVMNATSVSDIGMQLSNSGVTFSPVEVTNNIVNDMQLGTGYNLSTPCGSTGTPSTTNRSIFINNTVSLNGGGTGTYSGLILTSPTNMDVYHNTISVANSSTSSIAANLDFSTTSTFANNNVMNNALTNTGGGGTAVTAKNVTSNGNAMDYNNVFTNGTGNFGVNNSTSYTSFTAWRAANGQNKNSISYDPGYTSATNLVPDANKAASWSLNGRGKQLPVAPRDITGASRPTTLAAGVPDIGAYEFEPIVAPPDAVAVPATVTPGNKQYFLFGFDTVAVITWNPNMPVLSPLSVKQYSGRKAPGFNTISPNRFMYFYTDIASTASTYSYNAEMYYIDPWLGTIASEANLKLAQKYNNSAWIAYNGTSSSANISRNIIAAPDLTNFGLFTGIDTTVLSAVIKPKSSTLICNGNNVVLKANTGAGYTYQWSKYGNPIAGATADSFVATTSGDYTVTITSGSISATSIPVTVSVVAAPVALATASGPLTYCTGGNLQLSAATGPGLTYQWQWNGNNITGATNSTYNVTSAGTYTVVVRNLACGNVSSALTVAAGPLHVNLGLDTTFCEVKNQAFVINAGYPGAKYLWSTGDTTQSINVFSGSGSYSVLVDAGPNCIARDTINIVVKPLPNITGINYVNAGNSYTFNTAGAHNANAFLWLFGDGTTSTLQTVNKSFPDGNLVVKLVAFNECGSDTSSLVKWATDVNSVNADENSFSLYPNPAREKITIKPNGQLAITHITIHNATGQVVYNQQILPGMQEMQIDVSSFPTGIYLLKVNTSAGDINRSLSIER